MAGLLALREETRARPVPAGWSTVAGAFLILMAGFGALYSYAAYADALAAAFGAGRPAVAMVYAISGSSCFLVSALSGPLCDRLGPQRLAAAGMLLVGAGLAGASAATGLAGIYLGYGLMTGVGVGCAYVPALVAVQRCATVRRGLASGIAVSGIGLGTALIPVMARLLDSVGDWRAAFLVSGVLVAAVGVAGALLLASGEAGPERAGARPAADGTSPRRDLRLAYAGIVLVGVPAVLPHALLVATAQDLGLSPTRALSLLGLIGVGTMLGRFAIAALADDVGRRAMFVGCCLGMSASMLAWALAAEEATLRVFALSFGALQGGVVALLPAYVADSFGLGRLGSVMGTLYTARGVALLVGPPLLAWSIAAQGGTSAPLILAAMLGLAGTWALAAVRRG